MRIKRILLIFLLFTLLISCTSVAFASDDVGDSQICDDGFNNDLDVDSDDDLDVDSDDDLDVDSDDDLDVDSDDD